MVRQVTLAALMLALAAYASAQPSVTITLRSGDTVNVQLVDLGGVGFTVRDGGVERRIPPADVAVIDFGGGPVTQPREVEDLGGRHLLVLRDGRVVRGVLEDIGGVQPLRLTFKGDGGTRDYSSNDVRRIYMAVPPATAPSQPAAPSSPVPPQPSGGTLVRVQANQRWTPTGITVRRGDQVQFSPSGEVELASGGGVRSGPGGSSNRDAAAPVPGVATGTLIGRVDPGRQRVPAQPFVIGAGGTFTMPNDGTLYLGVNDSELSDNRGAYDVRVIAAGSNRRR